VKKTFMIVNTIVKNRPSQLDKIRGIREGKSFKKGILQKNLRVKQSNINLTKSVQPVPLSIFCDEMYAEKRDDFLSRKSLREENISSKRYDTKTRRDIGYST
jgi:hypothetical protein